MVLGLQRMVERIDENTASSYPSYSYLEPAFHRYRPWTEITQLAVWTAAISKDTEVQNVAIEALIEAIEDGRAHPDELARILVKLASGGWIKSNRLASALEQVGVVSDVHQYVVCTLLDIFLAEVAKLPKNAHHLLQISVNLHTTLGLPTPPDTKSKLQGIKGKGKAAQLAKSLCQFTGEIDLTVMHAASVEGRLSLIDALFPSNLP